MKQASSAVAVPSSGAKKVEKEDENKDASKERDRDREEDGIFLSLESSEQEAALSFDNDTYLSEERKDFQPQIGQGEREADKESSVNAATVGWGVGGSDGGKATADVRSRLWARGHSVGETVTGSARSVFGRGQIIIRDRGTGVLWGGSDPRCDGCAVPVI